MLLVRCQYKQLLHSPSHHNDCIPSDNLHGLAKHTKGTIMQVQSITPSNATSFDDMLIKMLPHFRYFAKRIKRKYKRFDVDDCLQELVGMALQMYRSLIDRGKEAYYSPLVRYAIARYKAGRRFTGQNKTDALSEYTQRLGRSEVCSFDQFDGVEGGYTMECFAPDTFRSVQMRMDYQTWYHRQSTRDQQIIVDLAMSHTTNEVAKMFGVTSAAISQKRRAYEKSWHNFIDPPENDCAAVAK